MEQLRAELSIVLGESISRLERVSEQPYAHMYSLYDRRQRDPADGEKLYLSRHRPAGGLQAVDAGARRGYSAAHGVRRGVYSTDAV